MLDMNFFKKTPDIIFSKSQILTKSKSIFCELLIIQRSCYEDFVSRYTSFLASKMALYKKRGLEQEW